MKATLIALTIAITLPLAHDPHDADCICQATDVEWPTFEVEE